MELIEYIKENNIETPVKLEIGLDAIKDRSNPEGNQKRYFHVFIDGTDVTKMVADFAGLHFSNAKDTNGSLIVHGCGMDMGLALQQRVYKRASAFGYPEMFSSDDYRYLGCRIRGIYQ